MKQKKESQGKSSKLQTDSLSKAPTTPENEMSALDIIWQATTNIITLFVALYWRLATLTVSRYLQRETARKREREREKKGGKSNAVVWNGK